jgi:hypothetical protein
MLDPVSPLGAVYGSPKRIKQTFPVLQQPVQSPLQPQLAAGALPHRDETGLTALNVAFDELVADLDGVGDRVRELAPIGGKAVRPWRTVESAGSDPPQQLVNRLRVRPDRPVASSPERITDPLLATPPSSRSPADRGNSVIAFPRKRNRMVAGNRADACQIRNKPS